MAEGTRAVAPVSKVSLGNGASGLDVLPGGFYSNDLRNDIARKSVPTLTVAYRVVPDASHLNDPWTGAERGTIQNLSCSLGASQYGSQYTSIRSNPFPLPPRLGNKGILQLKVTTVENAYDSASNQATPQPPKVSPAINVELSSPAGHLVALPILRESGEGNDDNPRPSFTLMSPGSPQVYPWAAQRIYFGFTDVTAASFNQNTPWLDGSGKPGSEELDPRGGGKIAVWAPPGKHVVFRVEGSFSQDTPAVYVP